MFGKLILGTSNFDHCRGRHLRAGIPSPKFHFQREDTSASTDLTCTIPFMARVFRGTRLELMTRLPRARCGRGSQWYRHRIVADFCHEFEPSTTEDPPCGRMHAKSVELKCLPAGVVWQLGEGASSCRPRHLTMVQNYVVRRQSPRAAEQCDVNLHHSLTHSPSTSPDEAHFWLNGYVNKQNCRIWSEANPQVYVETPLHPEKLTVWSALWAGGIIGPYFFKNDEGHNVTVNGDRYRAMITNFFIPELNNHDVQELWFQQDGAACHTARATIDLLKDTFGDRIISRFGPVNWPSRSCDLTLLDYFL
ncbi:uncharacterized protein TNCV_1395051 [Trichonephila clavipes]|nr:uncharacterized protein TNCV_1395051 [Trichonephila clavipes]